MKEGLARAEVLPEAKSTPGANANTPHLGADHFLFTRYVGFLIPMLDHLHQLTNKFELLQLERLCVTLDRHVSVTIDLLLYYR